MLPSALSDYGAAKAVSLLFCFSGADIDTLLVTPRHIERSDFFGSFPDFLKERAQTKDVRVSL